ncbi:MAG: winged helix DNA-binding protein [Chloroflexi bacterium]|nr:MAG: winged helix DNA-binding protein [Chloroflexota bacterium]TMG09463.1 MAG: winged helix DNA-binding protein [Chloroflexota bacterium]
MSKRVGHNHAMPVPPSLLDRDGALLVIAARTGQQLATRRLAPMGLTVQLCGVLNRLAVGPISQHELGQQLGIDRTTMVEVVDDLEARGVVVRQRNAADRRAYSIQLTPKGRTVQKRAAKAFDAAADEFFGPLRPPERQALSEMMRRLIAAADQKLGEPSGTEVASSRR